MNRKVVDMVSLFFIFCVGFLCVLSIMSVWKLVEGDILAKSISTIGIIAFASVVTILASHWMKKDVNELSPIEDSSSLPNFFPSLRSFTSVLLIISIVILTFVGILSIWDLIQDRDVLNRTISSMLIIAFSSVLVIATCAEREGKSLFGNVKKVEEGVMRSDKPLSVGRIILYVVLVLMFAPMLLGFLFTGLWN